jgi:hypothetical protein
MPGGALLPESVLLLEGAETHPRKPMQKKSRTRACGKTVIFFFTVHSTLSAPKRARWFLEGRIFFVE